MLIVLLREQFTKSIVSGRKEQRIQEISKKRKKSFIRKNLTLIRPSYKIKSSKLKRMKEIHIFDIFIHLFSEIIYNKNKF